MSPNREPSCFLLGIILWICQKRAVCLAPNYRGKKHTLKGRSTIAPKLLQSVALGPSRKIFSPTFEELINE